MMFEVVLFIEMHVFIMYCCVGGNRMARSCCVLLREVADDAARDMEDSLELRGLIFRSMISSVPEARRARLLSSALRSITEGGDVEAVRSAGILDREDVNE